MPEMHVTTPQNPRQATRAARQQRLKLATEGQAPTIKVYAANEDLMRVLRHANGTRFRAQLDQAVEWPNDNFTARRIAEGSVLTEGPAAAGKPAATDDKLNVRERAAALRPKPKTAPTEARPPRAETAKPAEQTQEQPTNRAQEQEQQPEPHHNRKPRG